LKVPAAHAVQVPPSGPLKPALQRQLLRSMLASGESECSRQLVHSALPLTSLYVPGGHAAQAPPSGPL
jgi:hypothetical protein